MKTEENILSCGENAVTLPTDLTLGQLMLDRLAVYKNHVAMIDGETNEEITYSEILSKSIRLAIYLTNQGLKKCERIAVCSDNCINYSIPLCSAFFLGVAICPLNPGYSRSEFIHALKISQPKYIFASKALVKILTEIAQKLPWPLTIVCLGKTAVGNAPCLDDLTGSVLAGNTENFKTTQSNPRDRVAAIMCSSGTTGLPKGVMLTDTNVLATLCSYLSAKSRSLSQNTTFLALLPYFHTYAFVTMILQLLQGGCAVVMPCFEPNKFLALVEKFKISTLLLVPPLLVFLAKSPLVDRYDLTCVKVIMCGAAPLSANIEKAVCKRLNLRTIVKGYGLTETTLGVVSTTMDMVNKPGSIGKLKVGVLAKVIPVEGSEPREALGPNKQGEFCFKGDQIMKGYVGDASSTAATIDKDGWLHTGDIGYYDEEGYFYIVDRLKELIKYKAFQVAPAELEAVLLTHREIADAAVIGIPDESSGELPFAFVVKQPDSKVTAMEIQKYVKERVSSPKWLRGGVKFLETIPKTSSGKILRRELRNSMKSKL